MDEHDSAEIARINEFEGRLSRFLADSGLSSYDALIATGISLARVLYGLELLHGKKASIAACELLDETITKSWEEFAANRAQLQ